MAPPKEGTKDSFSGNHMHGSVVVMSVVLILEEWFFTMIFDQSLPAGVVLCWASNNRGNLDDYLKSELIGLGPKHSNFHMQAWYVRPSVKEKHNVPSSAQTILGPNIWPARCLCISLHVQSEDARWLGSWPFWCNVSLLTKQCLNTRISFTSAKHFHVLLWHPDQRLWLQGTNSQLKPPSNTYLHFCTRGKPSNE